MVVHQQSKSLSSEKRESLQEIINNLPCMAYRCKNDKHWTMEFVSKGCSDLTGYSSDELIGNNRISYSDLILEEDREYVWNEVQYALKHKKSFEVEYRIKTASQAIKYVWEQGKSIGKTGNEEILDGFITDITDRQIRKPVDSEYRFGDLLGKSPQMARLFRDLDRLAKTDLSVLIEGETGTGKELAAQSLHDKGDRKDSRFIPVHLGGLTPELFSRELFGHVKEAFTGADSDKPGYFEVANGGTIFLDEVGEIPLQCQSILLRVLQERKVTPVGSTQEIDVDVRVIAATNKNLKIEIDNGNFRADLYERLNGVTIHMPALRNRPEDIYFLSNEILKKHTVDKNKPPKRFTTESWRFMERYEWPRNVRELENAIIRGVEFSDDQFIDVEHLKIPHNNQSGLHNVFQSHIYDNISVEKDISLNKIIKNIVIVILKENKGNKSKTARQLEISKSRLYRLIKP